MTVTNNLATLIGRYRASRRMSVVALARAANMDRGTLTGRLQSAANTWQLAEILSIATVLEIPDDDVIEAVFPGRSSGMVTVSQLERTVRDLEDQNALLKEGRYEPQSATRDLLLTGRWAVSALPVLVEPSPGHKVLSSIALSVTPLVPGAEALSVEDVRALLAREVPSIYRRAAVMSGATSQLPNPPGVRDTPLAAVVNLQVPVFAEDRDPAPPTHRTNFLYKGNGILVVASTLTAGTRSVAAILARSIGWGLTDTRTRARLVRPPTVGGEGQDLRNWMREESTRQLQNLLFETLSTRVISHSGHAVHGDGKLQHPLIERINTFLAEPGTELPYVVLLREEDAVLASAAARPYQESQPGAEATNTRLYAHLIATRDALWSSVSSLPTDRRTIINVRDVQVPAADPDWLNQSFARSARTVCQLLDSLTGDVKRIRILDTDARTTLEPFIRTMHP